MSELQPSFTVGQSVHHLQFGTGVVAATTRTRATVDFKTGQKTILSIFLSPSPDDLPASIPPEIHLAPRAANDNRPTGGLTWPSQLPPREDTPPVDLWAERRHPSLPRGLLPDVVEQFALVNARLMGADAGALAGAALAVCAAATPDAIAVQVKRHSTSWRESARIWVALVGDPSAKKSPIIAEASRPLKAIDARLYHQYVEARREWDALDKAVQAKATQPRHRRLRLEDTTIEAAQEVLKDSPNGVLCLQDELSGWFGSMDKYSGSRGAAKDRGFWLQAFNGGTYTVNRIGRGSSFIDNLSVCMLGGIQPEPIRKLAAEAHDDGLLQRLFPIVIGPAGVGVDEPQPPASERYAALVEHLHSMQRPHRGLCDVDLRFDEGAQTIRDELEAKHNELQRAWETINGKLASHIGKLDGLFARLCVLWHCIETSEDRPDPVIPEGVARRVSDFIHRFLLPHAVAFYSDVIGLADNHDLVVRVGGHILSHKLTIVTARDVRRGDRAMRALGDREAIAILHQLDALGWLQPAPLLRNETAARWLVRPAVHTMFARRAEQERERRKALREVIVQSMETVAA